MRNALPPFMVKIKAEQKRQNLLRKTEVPVTQKMLFGVRDELKAHIGALRHEINARFESTDAKFSKIDSQFSRIDSQFLSMTSEIRRLGVMIEEQNARNAIVLDGLASLFERQERIEKKAEALT